MRTVYKKNNFCVIFKFRLVNCVRQAGKQQENIGSEILILSAFYKKTMQLKLLEEKKIFLFDKNICIISFMQRPIGPYGQSNF